MASDHHPEPAGRESGAGDSRDARRSARGVTRASTRDTTSPQRLRPAPTSALSPAPGSLMPVPADDRPAPDSGRAGRRQHHRAPGGPGRPEAEDLVYLSGRIPRKLRDELHVQAIGEGRPVVELMRDALRGYLNHPWGSGRS